MKLLSTLFLKTHIPSSLLLLTFSKGTRNAKLRHNLCLCKTIQTSSYEEVTKGSYVPTVEKIKENTNNNILEKPSRTMESVGAFQKLPVVMPSVDILGSALKKARRISPTQAEGD